MIDIRCLNDIVDMAMEVKSFTKVIRETGITMDDISEIGLLVPDVDKSIQKIKDWFMFIPEVNNIIAVHEIVDEVGDFVDNVLNEKPGIEKPEKSVAEEAAKAESDDNTDDIDDIVLSQTGKIDPKDAAIVCEWIARKCNGRPLTEASNIASATLKINRQNILRLIRGDTYKKISPNYFDFVDGVVKSKIPSMDKLPIEISDMEKFNKVMNGIPKETWLPLMYELEKSNWWVQEWFNHRREANELIDKTDLVNAVTLRVAVVNGGCSVPMVLPDFDVSIMIADAVSHVGKKKIARLTNYCMKKWGINPKPDHVFLVINKKVDAIISDYFFK